MSDEAYALSKSDAEMAIRMLAQGPPPASIADKPQPAALRLYTFQITGDWQPGLYGFEAEAEIAPISGGPAISDKVTDPFGTFEALGRFSQGLALCQGSIFYVIQAPCPA